MLYCMPTIEEEKTFKYFTFKQNTTIKLKNLFLTHEVVLYFYLTRCKYSSYVWEGMSWCRSCEEPGNGD